MAEELGDIISMDMDGIEDVSSTVPALADAGVVSAASGSSLAPCGLAQPQAGENEPSESGAASSAGTGAIPSPPPTKVCDGCGCSAWVPSPLCAGQFRQGDYPDWSSNWDRHCASMARVRFTAIYGSLQGVADWLQKSAENKKFFSARLVAYYSLKAEGTVQRVTFQALESRVEVMEQLMKWQKCGTGLPASLAWGGAVVYDLKALGGTEDNPLLNGGQVVEMRKDGRAVLGVSMPVCPSDALRQGIAPIVDLHMDDEAFYASPLSKILQSKDIRCEDGSYLEAYKWMRNEVLELAKAKDQPAMEGEACERKGEKRLGHSSSSSWQLALRPAPGTPMDLHSRACGSDIDDRSDPAGSAPQSGKKRKVQAASLEREVAEKVKCLRHEAWMVYSCDKGLEGLITRLVNARAKLLDNCEVSEAKVYKEYLDMLTPIQDFGNIHKRGWQRTKKEQSLADLVRPLSVLREATGLKPEYWHQSLKELCALVDFQNYVTEGDLAKAMRLLDVQKLAKDWADETIGDQVIFTSCVMFATERIEKLVVRHIKLVKADKKKHDGSVEELYNAVKEIEANMPELPKGALSATYLDPQRNRAERLNDQVRALLVVVATALDAGGRQGYGPIWPSKVRNAVKILSDKPNTTISEALESFAGSRMMMSRVHSSQHRSAYDEQGVAMVGSQLERVLDFGVATAMAIDEFMEKVNAGSNTLVVLAEVVPKLSPVAYEEVKPQLRQAVGALVEVACLSNGILWGRIAQDLPPSCANWPTGPARAWTSSSSARSSWSCVGKPRGALSCWTAPCHLGSSRVRASTTTSRSLSIPS